MLEKIKTINTKYIKAAGAIVGAMVVGAVTAIVVGQLDENVEFFIEEPVEEVTEE